MQVPFVDLNWQNQQIKSRALKEIGDIFDSSSFICGKRVKKFEEDFAAHLKTDFVIGVNNGTSALHATLLALEIGPGDEVITVPNTFFATAEAIMLVGAKPVFVDIEENSFLMDASKIEAVISEKTKAIIPVHLYGQCADMDKILEIAKKHNLYVIEDACQAHGAEYNGKKAGTMGDLGCFSFYPGKNLGTAGEGGAVAVKDENLAKKIRMLRDHGSAKKYYHDLSGSNMRMTEIQGAVLDIKLEYLDKWNNLRREAAETYREELRNPKIILPAELNGRKHNYHLFVVRTKKRNELIEFLKANDVSTNIHYPIPVHLQKAYKNSEWSFGDFPVAENLSNEVISLPMFPGISKEQIIYVSQKINEFLCLI